MDQRRRCAACAALLALFCCRTAARADEWPQWGGPRRDGVWRETGIIARFEGPRIAARWRTPIGAGYAGPAVAGGRVFVTDRIAKEDVERVLCLDARTGAVQWEHRYRCVYRNVGYDAGPRCTPTVADGKVYTLGTMGHLFCLEAHSGKVVWSTRYAEDHGMRLPTWGVATAPLVDGERLIAIVGGESTVMAFDRHTGEVIWRALPRQEMGYAPPVIIERGGVRQLIVWLAERVVSLDPERGTVYWEQPFTCRHGMSVAMPVVDGNRLFVSTFYNGPLMLELAQDRPAAKVLWRGTSDSALEPETDKLHSLMCTPLLRGDALYGVCSYGALRGLDASTGRRLWETHAATGQGRWWNAFLIPHEGRVFIANEQGELIIARLSTEGYEEVSRAALLAPTGKVLNRRIVWSHPAFAYRHVFARNDEEIVCASLAAPGGEAVIPAP